jgi:DNA polymerase (family 10)
VDRIAVAAAVREIGRRLSLRGDNAFRARAYLRAADALDALESDLGELVSRGTLTTVPNVGAGLAAQIAELVRTGRSSVLEDLRAETPAIALEVAERANVSGSRAARLVDELKLTSLEDLRVACLEGRARTVSGIGPATEKRILESLARDDERRARTLLSDARRIAGATTARLEGMPARVEVAGDVRRWQETVTSVDIVIETEAPKPVLESVASDPRVVEEIERGDDLVRVRYTEGLVLSARTVSSERFASALLRATGSVGHLARLGEIAMQHGFTWCEDGTLVDPHGREVPLAGEADLYAALGLAFVPPELRDGLDEIDLARNGATAFDDLVDATHIRGMVHCHTTFSDGRNSVEEMALAADELGMEYLTITDHSPTASYANGVTLDRLKAQWDEIERVQETVRVKLLRGTESDILADGSLDYPDHVLEQFDVVIASIHARMRMDENQMTRRIVNAMKNPVFKIWGHALGRRLLERPPFACRVEEVLDAIAESRAAIEVNADPHRLEMEPRWIREARKRDIAFVVSTDAHSTGGLAYLPYGVALARRGGLQRGEVLNTRGVEAFRRAVNPAG